MASDTRRWVVSGIAAAVTGAVLAAFGMGGVQPAVAGAVVFVVTNLALKNGSGRRAIVEGSAAERDDVLAFSPTLGRSSIYVVRGGGKPSIGIDISIDDQPLARLKAGTFSHLTAGPGRHKIGATFTQGILGAVPVNVINVDVADNAVTIVEASMPDGISSKAVLLRSVDLDDNMRATLKTMRFIQIDQAEALNRRT